MRARDTFRNLFIDCVTLSHYETPSDRALFCIGFRGTSVEEGAGVA